MSISPERQYIQLGSFRSLPDLTKFQETPWGKKYFGKYLDKDSRYDLEIGPLMDIYAGFSEEQIIQILKEAEEAELIENVLNRYCITLDTYYTWCSKYSGLLPEIKKVKKLEEENIKIKQMLAEVESNIIDLKDKLLLFKNSLVKGE